jgi:hypothetical protein
MFMPKDSRSVLVIVQEASGEEDLDHGCPCRWLQPQLSRETISMNAEEDRSSTQQTNLLGFVKFLEHCDMQLGVCQDVFVEQSQDLKYLIVFFPRKLFQSCN